MALALTDWDPPRGIEAASAASAGPDGTMKSGPGAPERREVPGGSDGGVTAEAAMIVTFILDTQRTIEARRGGHHYGVVPLVDSLFVYWRL